MQGLTFLLLIWAVPSYFMGLFFGRRVFQSRVAFAIAFSFTLVFPFTDTFIGIYVAKSYQIRYGQLVPERPIETPGFFLIRARADDELFVSSFLPPRGAFDFVEYEFNEAVAQYPSSIDGPGLYLFRAVSPGEDNCAPKGVIGNKVGIYGAGGYCFRYLKTEKRVSRYGYEMEPILRKFPTVRLVCSRAVDLVSGENIGRVCSAHVFAWGAFPIAKFKASIDEGLLPHFLKPQNAALGAF